MNHTSFDLNGLNLPQVKESRNEGTKRGTRPTSYCPPKLRK